MPATRDKYPIKTVKSIQCNVMIISTFSQLNEDKLG
jgi:hypothetical protein